MVKNISELVAESMFQDNTEVVWVGLIEITLEDSVLRWVSNNEDVTHQSQVYSASDFSFTLPEQSEGTLPTLKFSIPNRSLTVLDAFIRQKEKAQVRVKTVCSLDWDKAVDNIPCELRNITFDNQQITADITAPDLLSEPDLARLFNIFHFPGLS